MTSDPTEEQTDVPGLHNAEPYGEASYNAASDGPIKPPGAFGIIDIFVLTTLVALAVAIAAPFFRALNRENLGLVGGIMALQISLVVATVAFLGRRRRKALAMAGSKRAKVYVGALRWRHWPIVFALVQLTALAAGQLVLAYVVSQTQHLRHLPFHWIQTSLFTGYVVARYLWRAFPCTIEVFEKGLIRSGSTFIAWSECDVRHSKIYPGRIVIVLKSREIKDTLVAHAPEGLQNELQMRGILASSSASEPIGAKNRQTRQE